VLGAISSGHRRAAPTATVDPGPAGDFLWKGLNWTRRTAAETGGPQYNGQYSAANVSAPDGNGYVTLSLTNPTGNSPTAAEMVSTNAGFGYGTYTLVVGSRLDTMHKAVVFGGLFTYDGSQSAAESKNEIDICETSAWGATANPVTLAHTYYQDDSNADGAPEDVTDFVSMTTDTVHTHQMIWAPGSLTFRSYSGTGTGGALIFQTVRTALVPVPAAEQLVINLWVFNLPDAVPKPTPGSATPTSVVLRDFSFVPATPPAATRTAWLWPFATTSFWNTPIGDGATYEASTATATANLLNTTFGMALNGDRWSHPTYRAAAGDPVVTVSEVDSSPRTITFQAVPASEPSQPPLAEGGDCNWHQVQPDGQFMYENWQAVWTGATTLNCGYNVRVDLLGDGRTGARAYGGSAIGGMVRQHEIASRNIPHAISIALTGNQLKSGFVWPARSQDSNGATSYAGQIPMGSLVAIPRTVDLSTLGLNADALALATALQLYGGYITARSGNMAMYVEPGSNATRVSAMRSQVAAIKAQLRVVTNNSQTTPGGPGNRLAPLAPTVVV
jgi:hypothetical protein